MDLATLLLKTTLAGAVLLVQISPAFSTPRTTFGLAALASAGRGFPCRKILKFYRHVPEVYHGSMWQTFGRRRGCWKKILKRKKPVALQVYGYNAVCVKKGNCAPYEMFSGISPKELNERIVSLNGKTLRKFRRFAEKFLEFCERNKKPGDQCLISPGLETQLSPEALERVVLTFVSSGWHYDQIVHNPSEVSAYRGRGRAGFLEWHNSTNTRGMRYKDRRVSSERFIFTFDGADFDRCNRGRSGLANRISSRDMRRTVRFYRNKARYVGFWCSSWQGLSVDSKSALPPRARRYHVLFRDLSYLLKLTRDRRLRELPIE